MNTEERISKQRELIEEMGRYFDKEGFQPIAGRIIGLLMVMDKEQFTFDEICEELQISKSSASNALRNLEIRGVIEYVTLPGDRKRYFQIKREEIPSVFDDVKEKLTKTIKMLSYIQELKADKNSKNAIYFKELTGLTEYMLAHLEKAMEEYLKKV